MVRRLAVLLAACCAVLVAGCGPDRPPVDPTRQPLPLEGPAVTFQVGDQRFAVAAFAPPASLVVVRAGSVFLWGTPNPAVRNVYLEDVVGDRPADRHLLQVNGAGRVDCTYALHWDR